MPLLWETAWQFPEKLKTEMRVPARPGSAEGSLSLALQAATCSLRGGMFSPPREDRGGKIKNSVSSSLYRDEDPTPMTSFDLNRLLLGSAMAPTTCSVGLRASTGELQRAGVIQPSHG